MPEMRYLFCTVLLLTICGGCGPSSPAPAEFDASLPDGESESDSDSGGRIRRHMEVLASDDMQGREAGTAGYRKAAAYVAAQFADIGLQPFGDDGSYYQNVEFFDTRLQPGSELLALQRGKEVLTLEAGTDFVRSGGFGPADESVSAALVFAGFGIRAPEKAHDDYADVDVAGKIVVVLTGAPPQFANDERAYYSSASGKQALAADRGALGIVTIRTPVDQERLTWPRVRHGAESSAMRWLGQDGQPHEGYPQLAGGATLSQSGAEKLFALAGRDLDALFERYASGVIDSFDIGVTMTTSRRSVQTRSTSANVLGLLRGSDPSLRNEFILFTAHLDHLGLVAGVEGDNIYNGAYDNAAGVATLLEVAATLTKRSTPPRRSILFVAFTAEEKGEQGSDYLAHHPPVPIADIVADINVDMPFFGYPIADVEGFGVEHSSLHEALLGACAAQGLTLTPDPKPELVRFIRSDQFSFVKRGVPGLNLKPGSRSADPNIDGSALRTSYLTGNYHSTSDDLELPFSEAAAARFARLAESFTLDVTDDDEAPRWNDGDFFGDRFRQQAD